MGTEGMKVNKETDEQKQKKLIEKINKNGHEINKCRLYNCLCLPYSGSQPIKEVEELSN